MRKLTKSRFKLGIECPNKLFYTNKKEYVNNKQSDPFLQALASGGFQVEELARLTYPNGIFIDAPHYDYELAINQTLEYLKHEEVILYEAAFSYETLFVRTDIVKKTGNKIQLIEVKAKSFDPSDTEIFVGKRGDLKSGWKNYLYDLAYQKYVAQLAFPMYEIEAILYMADKTKKASIDNLNQFFRVPKDGDPRKEVFIPKDKYQDIISSNVLTQVNVDDIINAILNNKYKIVKGESFSETVNRLVYYYTKDIFSAHEIIFSTCKSCEFKASTEQKAQGLKCGYSNCFKTLMNWSEDDIQKPKTYEVWNFRGVDKLAKEGRYLMEQMTIDDFKVASNSHKLGAGDRQWLQVEKYLSNDNRIYVDKAFLQEEMDKWIYPLHFIDFETSAVALPFTAGRKPYEQVAFQFSHHMVDEEGNIIHKTQYLNGEPGNFPNFQFVRELKKALGNDEGTIFRFAAHENSILNTIKSQLEESNEPDKFELISFIKSITNSTNNSADSWGGTRSMVDLREVIMGCYYNPLTNGSNSIKYVLPAILNSSNYLKSKYKNPIKNINVTSLNFNKDQCWIFIANDEILNPYRRLPSLFNSWSKEEKQLTISELEDIDNGGAALTAYAKLQYVEMSNEEREEIINALFKYCELDTLAMVMIYEHFKYDLILEKQEYISLQNSNLSDIQIGSDLNHFNDLDLLIKENLLEILDDDNELNIVHTNNEVNVVQTKVLDDITLIGTDEISFEIFEKEEIILNEESNDCNKLEVVEEKKGDILEKKKSKNIFSIFYNAFKEGFIEGCDEVNNKNKKK